MTKNAGRTYPAVSDESLLRVAISTYDGLEVLVREGAGSHLIPAMGILAALSLETCLKAYLMQTGNSESDVKHFRHRIPDLWEAAGEAGLKLERPIPDWAINLANYHDDPYHFRYPPHQYGTAIHDPVMIAKELCGIIEMVKRSSSYIL